MAANDLYFERGTLIGTWDDTGTTGTLAIRNTAAANGEHGDRIDRGGSPGDPRPHLLLVEAGIRWVTPVVDELASIWLCHWDEDGDDPAHPGIATTAASLGGVDELKGLDFVMNVIAGSTTSGDTFMSREVVAFPHKFIAPVVFNAAATSATVDTDDVSWVKIYEAVLRRQTS